MTDHRVHVVTDSTASLPAGPDERLRAVPLHVIVDDESHLEGVGLTAEDVAAHLQAGHRVTTSQPTPRAFGEAYAAAAAAGAREIVSVHLSGQLSGTVHAAALAAADAPVPVRVVDSRTVAMGLGFAARDWWPLPVSLYVILHDESHLAAVGPSAEDVAAPLQSRHLVTSSQPLPRAFGEAYAAAAAAGAREIFSVHLSG